MSSNLNIITGEKIQQLCDIYIGEPGDFNFNPVIRSQTSKHKNIKSINESYNNPKYVFCYSHLIENLCSVIDFFQNDFVLVTHNSDQNIEPNDHVMCILKCSKLIKWFCQNLAFENNKLQLLPIGIANSMWRHGIYAFANINLSDIDSTSKNNLVYFNFNIITNKNKREKCFHLLRDRLDWLDMISPDLNLKRLAEHQFCICPEGNGLDTHRLWECLYLKVVPIVIDSSFTQVLMKNNIPLVVLNNWNDLDLTQLNYSDYSFDNIRILDFNNLVLDIKNG